MPDRKLILVVEDEEALRMGLEENLRYGGYDVLTAGDGASGLKLALEKKPDLLVLDVMLPGLSGYEVCRGIRVQGLHMPVLMLTARQDEFDKLHGFEVGADDYVTKPFSLGELMARVKALLRRGVVAVGGEAVVYAFGDFQLDTGARILRHRVLSGKGGKTRVESWEEITMTRTEFDLLAYFCANEGKALSREVLMNDVWGLEYMGTQRSIDSFVATIRGKIEGGGKAKFIHTVHGVGYKFQRESK